ncbi:hypothetical protein [Kibdelosporangium phytohabitans]|uniref:hypothetical protein n=1 Tax=Kibdelosporangium phytohabitans TaxID=860235 RepID=UPI0012F969FD|nr:hypothetical protein [Kibdelosporangium phytohabitans]MBE1470982.1 hypothetical protein [Kibdelosporangium phytohabitans]
MTDTPIYDQLRLELSSRRAVADPPPPKQSPPKPRTRSERVQSAPPVRSAPATEETRNPVSVWTLVNANRKN